MKAVLLVVGMVSLVTGLIARERISVEVFARTPETSGARLSPDGKSIAFVREYNGHRTLHVTDLQTGTTLRMNLGQAALADGAEKDVGDFVWVGKNRILVTTLVWYQI